MPEWRLLRRYLNCSIIRVKCSIIRRSLFYFKFIRRRLLADIFILWEDKIEMDYCECRNFQALHIFAVFVLMKYPCKYVYHENDFYYAIYRQ